MADKQISREFGRFPGYPKAPYYYDGSGLGLDRRRVARIKTEPLVNGAYEEGELSLEALKKGQQPAAGAMLLALLGSFNTRGCWLRLYANETDRTLDRNRGIDAAPTTPIILDYLFRYPDNMGVRLYTQDVQGVPAFNWDEVAEAKLYYRIDVVAAFQPDANSGIAFSGSGVEQEDWYLSDHGPFEYTHTPADSSYGGNEYGRYYIPWYGGLRCVSTNDNYLARYTTGALPTDHIQAISHTYRDGQDAPGWSCMHAFRVKAGSPFDIEYLRLGLTRAGVDAANAQIEWVDSDGVVHVLATSAESVSYPLNGTLYFKSELLTVEGDRTARVYTGSAPDALTLAVETVLDSEVTDVIEAAGHDRVGVFLQRGLVPGYTYAYGALSMSSVDFSGEDSSARRVVDILYVPIERPGGETDLFLDLLSPAASPGQGATGATGDGRVSLDPRITGSPGTPVPVLPGGDSSGQPNIGGVFPVNPKGEVFYNNTGFWEAVQEYWYTLVKDWAGIVYYVRTGSDDIGWSNLVELDLSDFEAGIYAAGYYGTIVHSDSEDLVPNLLDADSGTGWETPGLMGSDGREDYFIILKPSDPSPFVQFQIGAVRLKNVANAGNEPSMWVATVQQYAGARAPMTGAATRTPVDADSLVQFIGNAEGRALIINTNNNSIYGPWDNTKPWSIDELTLYKWDESTPYAVPDGYGIGWMYAGGRGVPITQQGSGFDLFLSCSEGLVPYMKKLSTPTSSGIRYATAPEYAGETLPPGAVGWLVIDGLPQEKVTRTRTGYVQSTSIVRASFLVPHYGVTGTGYPTNRWHVTDVTDATTLPPGAHSWLEVQTNEGDRALIPRWLTFYWRCRLANMPSTPFP